MSLKRADYSVGQPISGPQDVAAELQRLAVRMRGRVRLRRTVATELINRLSPPVAVNDLILVERPESGDYEMLLILSLRPMTVAKWTVELEAA